jgi:hypothetical protein
LIEKHEEYEVRSKKKTREEREEDSGKRIRRISEEREEDSARIEYKQMRRAKRRVLE